MNPESHLIKQSDEYARLSAWAETVNPLRGLTITGAQNIFDGARRGDTRLLQTIYHELEGAIDPLFVMCDRREAGIRAYDWGIGKREAGRTRGYDEKLAADQAATLEEILGEAEQIGFNDVATHLGQGFFRGFAHVAPYFTSDGKDLEGFDLLDARQVWWSWDRAAWGYDGAYPDNGGLIISLTRHRHIDYPAMPICLRAALGEKNWGKFIDRYGIPPVIVIMPPDIPADRVHEYRIAAQRIAQAGEGALPHGSDVKYATDARGVNPFTEFLAHGEKRIILLGTGGLLTSLDGATGIGKGATEAHEKTWAQIVRRDTDIIGDVINRGIASRLLSAHFPGRPQLAYFRYEPLSEEQDAGVIFDWAGKARTAGYYITQGELEERTGLNLKPAPDTPPDPVEDDDGAPDARKGAGKPRENAPDGETIPTPGETLRNASEARKSKVEELADEIAADIEAQMAEALALAAADKGEMANEN